MRNDPSKQPTITFGRTFVMEFLTRLHLDDDPTMMKGLTIPLVIKLEDKMTAQGWRMGTDLTTGEFSNIFRLPVPGINHYGNIVIGADEFTENQWSKMEAWLTKLRRDGCWRLTSYPSPALKKSDYNNTYITVDNIIRDVRILLAAYF